MAGHIARDFADLRHESTSDLIETRRALQARAGLLTPRDAARLDACRSIIRARRNAARQNWKG